MKEFVQKPPAQFRIRWEKDELILEELTSDSGYIERSRPGIASSSTPVVVTHPESKILLSESLKNIKKKWLGTEHALDVVLSPPWGSAWLFDVGSLSNDLLDEQVTWELRQRLTESLDHFLFSWFQREEQVYAVAIRPDFIEFWEKLSRKHNITLGSISNISGLLPPETEVQIDLLEIYETWKESDKSGVKISDDIAQPKVVESVAEEAAERIKSEPPEMLYVSTETDEEPPEEKPEEPEEPEAEEKLDAPVEEEIKTEPVIEEQEPDLDTEEEQEDEFDDEYFKPKRRTPVIIGVIVTFLVIAAIAVFMFRDKIFKPGLVVPEVAEEVEEVPVDPYVGSAAMTSASFLKDIFRIADSTNISLLTVMLVDNNIRCKSTGRVDQFETWAAKVAEMQGIDIANISDPVPNSPGPLVTFTIQPEAESLMAATQFVESVTGIGAVVKRNSITSLSSSQVINLMDDLGMSRHRPYRLSFHKIGTDRYDVLAMP